MMAGSSLSARRRSGSGEEREERRSPVLNERRLQTVEVSIDYLRDLMNKVTYLTDMQKRQERGKMATVNPVTPNVTCKRLVLRAGDTEGSSLRALIGSHREREVVAPRLQNKLGDVMRGPEQARREGPGGGNARVRSYTSRRTRDRESCLKG